MTKLSNATDIVILPLSDYDLLKSLSLEYKLSYQTDLSELFRSLMSAFSKLKKIALGYPDKLTFLSYYNSKKDYYVPSEDSNSIVHMDPLS